MNAYVKWLNPKDQHIGLMMPGDLRGRDTEEAIVQLITYGMIAVELESPSGDPLNIANGKKATIELPLPSDLQAGAPNAILLWHFNEITGYWEEEGSATLQGNKYVGEVSHFSFWNCDLGVPFTDLIGNLVDDDGNPLATRVVMVTINSSALTAFTYTNGDGGFSGKVPQDEVLTIEVLDHCGEAIYSEQIGPFTEDEELLGAITIPTGNYFFTFTASLIDCDGNPVSYGYAKVKIDTRQFYATANENGIVTLILNNCDEEMAGSIVGYDLIALKESLSLDFDINGQTSIDAGTIEVCDELSEHITYTIDGNDRIIPAPYFTLSPTTGPTIGGFKIDTTELIIRFQSALETGNVYNPSSMSVITNLGSGNYFNTACESTDCNSVTVTIINYDTVEGVIEGSFTGTLPEEDTGAIYDIDGTFKVLID